MSKVEVKILFFGKARELVDNSESKIKVTSPTNYEELKKQVFHENFPVLGPIEATCMLAVDQNYVNSGEPIQLTAASEIAVIPPLSGG